MPRIFVPPLPTNSGDSDIQRIIIMIQGPGWEDIEDTELSRLPGEGDPVETKYGTCFVTEAQATPDADQYDGRITCRLPG